MLPLDQLFEQFVRERTSVQNVTPRTCEWYRTAFAPSSEHRRTLLRALHPRP